MLPLQEAQQIIVNALQTVSTETIPFSQCRGRILGQDVFASRQLPPFDNSAMDGYAVCRQDTLNASKVSPVALKVAETIPAGSISSKVLQRGEAFRIFTGAAIPEGADTVVIQENTSRHDDVVQILQQAKPQEHIRFRGEDVELKSLLLNKGSRIGPGEMAMLAAQGQLTLEVFQRPRIAVLPTGDEIKPLDHPLKPGQIPNSNSHMLAAQAELCGAVAIQQPIAPDNPEALLQSIMRAAKDSDLILTCGGVSVGDFDYVKSTLEKQGEVDFWKVAIKPGKPLAFGRIGNTPILGLPGNPVSSFVTFELFARPAILKLAGNESEFAPRTYAKLTHCVKQNKTREQFLRATVSQNETGLEITANQKQGSGQLSSLLRINSLAHIPMGEGELPAGASIEAIFLPT